MARICLIMGRDQWLDLLAVNVGKLRQTLADLGSILTAAGSKKPAEDVAHLTTLMEGREHQNVAEFLSDLRDEITGPSSSEVVVYHCSNLRDAGTDEVSFERAVRTLKSDKSVKKAEAELIAHSYIGGRDKWPSRAAAIAAIEKEFVSRRYDASKMNEVARSRPW